jgi:heat shock protein HslJ
MKIIPVTLLACVLLGGSCASMKKDTAAKTTKETAMALTGTWVLDLIPYPSGTIDSLYPGQKPELTFEPATGRLSGYTGCNRLNGPLIADKQSLNFKGDIAMTMMACKGDGESVFMEHLKKINRYDVSADGKTLTMIQGDIALLRFHKK